MPRTAEAAAPVPSDEDARLAANAARKNAAELLMNYRINDTLPFCGGALDATRSLVQQAHALCILIPGAIRETQNEKNGDCPFYSHHIASAFDAVGTLLAVAQFVGEALV